jgi:Flp pilus assembly pilin Flp
MRALTAFGKEEDGAAAIEAALILPVAIFLIMGALEASLTFYTFTEMQHRTRDFVRRVAVGSLTPAQAEAELGSSLPSWASAYATAEVTETDPGNPEVNIITASITVPIRHGSPLTFFSEPLDADMTAANSMKQERVP